MGTQDMKRVPVHREWNGWGLEKQLRGLADFIESQDAHTNVAAIWLNTDYEEGTFLNTITYEKVENE